MQFETRNAGLPSQYHTLKLFVGDCLMSVHTSFKMPYLLKIAKSWKGNN